MAATLFFAPAEPMQSLCVRFATTVASGHATLATKRTLLLTWTGLPPAGSHQLRLALTRSPRRRGRARRHSEAKRFGGLEISLDHLVGTGEKWRRDFESERPGCFEVDDEFKFVWRLHW